MTSKQVLFRSGAREAWVDLVEAGIVDPTKAVRIALENAVSAASLLLLTEATMTEVPGKTKDDDGDHLHE